MNGFPIIGSIYSFRINGVDKSLLFAVIENNLNENTTTLVVIEEGPYNGKKIKVNAKKVYESDPVGPIFPLNGEIVVENGIECIKQRLGR